MTTLRFKNKAEYLALVALAGSTPVATDTAAVAAQTKAKAELDAYHVAVAAQKKAIGRMEIDLRVRKAVVNGDNVILVTPASDANPFHSGTVSVSKKMVISWASDQGLKPAAYFMLLNQGQARITGTAFVVDAGDTWADKKGVVTNYNSPSLRLEDQNIELGGAYSKTIQTAIANAAVKAVMGAFDATDDVDLDLD